MSMSGDGCEHCNFKGCVRWDFANDRIAEGEGVSGLIPCPHCSPWAIEALERAANPPPDYRAMLAHALPFCYFAADQTVQCPECDAVWWGVPEELDENWHAPDCLLFAARVAVGQSKNVRRRTGDEDLGSYAPNDPRPDTRTPSAILRDEILGGWFSRLASMQWSGTPEGMSDETWHRAIHEVIERLQRAKETGPTHGPYAVGEQQ